MKITDLRKRIDEIDSEIITLFKERMNVVLGIAEYKKENALVVADKAREREVLYRMMDLAGEDLETYTKTLYQTILSLSRGYQSEHMTEKNALTDEIKAAVANTPKKFPKRATVACQGVEGAYSQIACEKLFSAPQILYFDTFNSVFEAVEKGTCKYGILPIENSSYGSVSQTYDLMKQHNFHIVRSIKLKVDHALVTKPGTKLEDIKEIISHEQAIGQCAIFLKGLNGVEIKTCENTAVAAQMVANAQVNTLAAISSPISSKIYGLDVLKTGIQDNASNFTRFICISKDLEIYPDADKISLMLSVSHTPGALFDVLSKFAALDVNIVKLESRPLPGTDFEFLFYFDVDSTPYSEKILKLLSKLSESLEIFVFLGSYGEK